MISHRILGAEVWDTRSGYCSERGLLGPNRYGTVISITSNTIQIRDEYHSVSVWHLQPDLTWKCNSFPYYGHTEYFEFRLDPLIEFVVNGKNNN